MKVNFSSTIFRSETLRKLKNNPQLYRFKNQEARIKCQDFISLKIRDITRLLYLKFMIENCTFNRKTLNIKSEAENTL